MCMRADVCVRMCTDKSTLTEDGGGWRGKWRRGDGGEDGGEDGGNKRVMLWARVHTTTAGLPAHRKIAVPPWLKAEYGFRVLLQ